MADEQDPVSLYIVDMADKLLRISIRNVPLALWRRVRVLAIKRTVPVSAVIIEALERYLETEEKK